MGISHYLKEIGRGTRGSKPLTRPQAADLFGQLLDGQLSELEIGAFCLAMRVKGETAQEMAGFLDATESRLALLPASDRPVVVLPSYNGARKLPVLTPLLALLLAREGLPVLLHGSASETHRVLASDVLAALGIQATNAIKKIQNGHIAVVDTALLHPGLERLLQVRRVLGLRNAGHSVVKLMQPVDGPAVVIGSYTHTAFGNLMAELYAQRGCTALLSRGLEGEVVCDPRRTPQLESFVAGRQHLLQAQQAGTASDLPGLPQDTSIDACVDYTRRVLAGTLALPHAIATQLRHLLDLAQLNTAP